MNPDVRVKRPAALAAAVTAAVFAVSVERSGAAEVRFTTEYIYPTEYTVQGGTATAGGAWGGTVVQNPIVIPGNFETREVGVVMSVDAVYISPAGFDRAAKVVTQNGRSILLNGNTELMLAATSGDAARTQALLDKGAKVNAHNKFGSTALMGAAAGGFEPVVSLLLGQGATADARASNGCTPLIYAARNGHLAVAKLLLDKGATVDTVDGENQTALMYAVQGGHKDVVKLLMDRGADTTVVSRRGHTATSVASKTEKSDILVLLTRAEKKTP